MLVSFLGSPASGKTTIAAQVFAELKKSGQPNVEFIAEQARVYIAEMKEAEKGPVLLNDDNQIDILWRQWKLEQLMVNATGPNGIVVTDSSALNSLWYMHPSSREYMFRQYPEIVSSYQSALVFKCDSFFGDTDEALRVHSQEQSLQINQIIENSLIEKPLNTINFTRLVGSIDYRTNVAVRRVYEELFK